MKTLEKQKYWKFCAYACVKPLLKTLKCYEFVLNLFIGAKILATYTFIEQRENKLKISYSRSPIRWVPEALTMQPSYKWLWNTYASIQ